MSHLPSFFPVACDAWHAFAHVVPPRHDCDPAVHVQVLWDVSIEEGRDLYGPDYMDVWTIDKFHQIGASDIECDHLHGELRSSVRVFFSRPSFSPTRVACIRLFAHRYAHFSVFEAWYSMGAWQMSASMCGVLWIRGGPAGIVAKHSRQHSTILDVFFSRRFFRRFRCSSLRVRLLSSPSFRCSIRTIDRPTDRPDPIKSIRFDSARPRQTASASA